MYFWYVSIVVEYMKRVMPKLLKSQSSSHIRAKYSSLAKVYFKKKTFWLRVYFVSSVGLDEENIKRYVEGAKI